MEVTIIQIYGKRYSGMKTVYWSGHCSCQSKSIPAVPTRRREADRYEREKVLYKQRSVTIEPFFDCLDQCFQIEPAWQKGLANNQSIGLLWITGYLLMVLYLSRIEENPEPVNS